MNEHKRKMIAPIVVAVLLVLYYVVYFGLLIALLPGVWKILFGIVPLLLAVVTVKVCIERIREIKKGEEDDLSQY
ncbi:MAG: hypothetical protein E7549_01425 [Ruminococcaceae bacterium]|nr:hypothetical protein [Oscillospiraceae bacterium]